MPDKDFEKQVQKKMDELKFVPSDAVWQEVEKQITNRKKRRRFLIWIPFLFVAAGGSFILIHNINSGNITNWHAHVNQTTLPSDATRKDPESADTSKAITANKSALKSNKTAGSQNKTADIPGESIIEKETPLKSANNQTNHHFEESEFKDLSSNHNKNQHSSSIKIHKDANKKIVNDYIVIDADEKTIANGEKKMIAKTEEQALDINKNKSKESMKIADPSLIENLKNIAAINPPVNEKKQVDSPVTSADSGKKPIALAKNKKQIEWGININAGKSNISKGLIGVFNTTADSYYANAYNVPGSVTNNAGNGKPSSVKAGMAFSVGLSVRKVIGKNWSVFADLDYGYYSTKMGVGQKIDSSRSVMQTGTGTYYNISSFYTSTPGAAINYTNRFHFIEMPVGLEKRFGTKSHFSINGGGVIFELIGSNALHYDAQKNIYYKNNRLINKTQLSAFAGFNYQLRLCKSAVIETGPRFQYGLTDFFNKDLYGRMHLLSGSLSARLLFGK